MVVEVDVAVDDERVEVPLVVVVVVVPPCLLGLEAELPDAAVD